MRNEDETMGDISREAPFGLEGWEIIPARNLIRQDGKSVILQPKIMRLLAVLAARPGETLSRDELIARVWYGINVSDAAIDRAVCSLRKALGDSATQPRFIERIRKRGVRLMVDPVDPEPEPAAAKKGAEMAFGHMASVVSLAGRRSFAAPFLMLIAGLLALAVADRASEAMTAKMVPDLEVPASMMSQPEPATVSMTPMRYSSTDCEADPDPLFTEDAVTDI